LPYRGLGSGIKRALDAWPEIDFIDDRDGCLFTAIVHRKTVKSSEIVSVKTDGSPKSSPKSSVKTEDRILDLIRQDNAVTTEQLGVLLGICPARGGHWEVL